MRDCAHKFDRESLPIPLLGLTAEGICSSEIGPISFFIDRLKATVNVPLISLFITGYFARKRRKPISRKLPRGLTTLPACIRAARVSRLRETF